MSLRTVLASVCLGWCALAMPASAKPPLEAFGDVPQIRGMELSPDGKKIAFLQRINGDDHSLVDNDSRRTVLTALGEFLSKHIGPK
jgi:hypothetical protein